MNVVDGTLTARDIKEGSITFDRLKGKLPAGAAGRRTPRCDRAPRPGGARGRDRRVGAGRCHRACGTPATKLWALVRKNGTIVATSTPGFSVPGSGYGSTTVRFPQSVASCAVGATIAADALDAYAPRGETKVFQPLLGYDSAGGADVTVSMTSDGDGTGSMADQRDVLVFAFC